MDKPSTELRGNPYANHARTLRLELLLTEEDIYREDNGDEEVEDHADERADCSNCSAYKCAALGLKPIFQRFELSL